MSSDTFGRTPYGRRMVAQQGVVHDVRLFDVQPTIDGYIVIATDSGRPLTESYPQAEAMSVAADLNAAAKLGKRQLAAALKAS